MRGALASLLLVAFSLGLIAPLLAASPSESSLPACCRRDGKHRCAMASTAQAPGGPALKGVGGKCAQYPPQTPEAASGKLAFAPPSAFDDGIPALTPSAILAQAEARHRVSRSRTRQKRGPPRSASV